MRTLAQVLAYGVGGVLLLMAIVVTIMVLQVNARKSDAIRSALTGRYPGASVAVDAWDEGPADQFCFALAVTNGTGIAVRKFASVNGDIDGGSYTFGKEYKSMVACTAAYYRG